IVVSAFVLLFFFFSSRRRHTRFSRDWSSDVCSSDLGTFQDLVYSKVSHIAFQRILPDITIAAMQLKGFVHHVKTGVGGEALGHRSEERRVGKEGRSRWWPVQ